MKDCNFCGMTYGTGDQVAGKCCSGSCTERLSLLTAYMHDALSFLKREHISSIIEELSPDHRSTLLDQFMLDKVATTNLLKAFLQICLSNKIDLDKLN